MKRGILFTIIVILSVGIIAAIVYCLNTANFALSPEYYGVAEIEPLDLGTLQTLIDEEKSFGLFVSQPACQASADLEQYIEEFQETHPLKFYEISFSSIKDAGIIPGLRFYPSFVLFHDGEVVDFLEANSDEDASAYTSTIGFTNWFIQYAKVDI